MRGANPADDTKDDRMKNRLIYLPLGGAGEIGMNAYVYGYGPEDRERGFSRGSQYLRDAGVFVRSYGEGASPRSPPR